MGDNNISMIVDDNILDIETYSSHNTFNSQVSHNLFNQSMQFPSGTNFQQTVPLNHNIYDSFNINNSNNNISNINTYNTNQIPSINAVSKQEQNNYEQNYKTINMYLPQNDTQPQQQQQQNVINTSYTEDNNIYNHNSAIKSNVSMLNNFLVLPENNILQNNINNVNINNNNENNNNNNIVDNNNNINNSFNNFGSTIDNLSPIDSSNNNNNNDINNNILPPSISTTINMIDQNNCVLKTKIYKLFGILYETIQTTGFGRVFTRWKYTEKPIHVSLCFVDKNHKYELFEARSCDNQLYNGKLRKFDERNNVQFIELINNENKIQDIYNYCKKMYSDKNNMHANIRYKISYIPFVGSYLSKIFKKNDSWLNIEFVCHVLDVQFPTQNIFHGMTDINQMYIKALQEINKEDV